jgi:O-methyltransferase
MPSLAHNQRLQKFFGGGFLERAWLAAISKAQMFLLGRHKEPNVVRLIRQTRRERTSLLTAYEAYGVYSLARAYRDVPGDMAEVGVFQGASARLMCEAKGGKTLHLFDTFEGLPKASHADGVVHAENQYTCSLESVKSYLHPYKDVHFYKGRFPDLAGPLESTKFSFVHFDVDLYESTLACLKFFYPRMTPGGVMLSHDYSLLAGVHQAFDEFFADKLEKPIEFPSTQCLVVRLPNAAAA